MTASLTSVVKIKKLFNGKLNCFIKETSKYVILSIGLLPVTDNSSGKQNSYLFL